MRQYVASWENSNGTRQFGIVEDTMATGESVTMTAGATPFMAEMDGENDPMMAVRYQTAELSVIARYDEVFDLDNDSRYRVTLNNTSGALWKGWLTSEAQSMAYDENLNEVAYACVDDLGHTKTMDVDVSEDWLSLGDLLMQATGEQRTLYVGNGMPLHQSGSITTTLAMKTVSSNWLDDDGKAKTLHDALEDWMKVLGCTLMSDGVNWWIMSDGDTMYTPFVLTSASIVPASGQPVSVGTQMDNGLFPMGDNEMTVERQAKSVTVVSGGEDMSNIDLPKITAENCKVVAYGESFVTPSVYADYYMKFYCILYGTSHEEGVELHQYNLDPNSKLWEDEYVRPTTQPGTIDVNYGGSGSYRMNPLFKGGAVLLKQDYWNTHDQYDKGSGDYTSSHIKYNVELREQLYIVQAEINNPGGSGSDILTDKSVKGNTYASEELAIEHAVTLAHGVMNKPLAVSRSKHPITIKGGGFFVKFEATEYTDKIRIGYYNFSPTKMQTERMDANLFFSVKIGDKWLGRNGNMYDEEQIHNTGSLEGDRGSANDYKKVVNNVTSKTYETPYVAEGFCLDAPATPTTGIVEIRILGFCNPTTERVGTNYRSYAKFPKVVQVNSLDFGYVPSFEDSNNLRSGGSGSSTKDRTSKNEQGVDEISVETSLCSDNGNAMNTGMMYSGNNAVRVMVSGGRTDAPEELLLERLRGQWFRSRRLLTLCFKDSFNPKPDKLLRHMGSDWRLMRVDEYDYRNQQVTATYMRTT